MPIGYTRVSTKDQDRALQLDALNAAGCEKVFEETASGGKIDREQLAAALEFMRDGDTLVVWKLDRLARSMRQLIETIEDLRAREVGDGPSPRTWIRRRPPAS
jgi:DNA invertase Pin-like site-specific DNA recombinase